MGWSGPSAAHPTRHGIRQTTRHATNHVHATPAAHRDHRSRASQTATRRLRPAPVAEGCSVAPDTAAASLRGIRRASGAGHARRFPTPTCHKQGTPPQRGRSGKAAIAARGADGCRAQPVGYAGRRGPAAPRPDSPRRGGSPVTDLRPRGAALGRGLGADAKHQPHHAPRHQPRTRNTCRGLCSSSRVSQTATRANCNNRRPHAPQGSGAGRRPASFAIAGHSARPQIAGGVCFAGCPA